VHIDFVRTNRCNHSYEEYVVDDNFHLNLPMLELFDFSDLPFLIEFSLIHLKIIQFMFSCDFDEKKSDIIFDRFHQFRSDFWLNHHCFTEFATVDGSACIYTVYHFHSIRFN